MLHVDEDYCTILYEHIQLLLCCVVELILSSHFPPLVAMLTVAAVAFNPPSAFINRGHQRKSSLESSQVASQIQCSLHSASDSSLSASVGGVSLDTSDANTCVY